MENNVGPTHHSIQIQCGTEWMVPFAEPIQCRIKCRIHCIHHFCPCSFPFFTSEWLTFTNSCNIIMFLYFFYASNETKTKQIGQVLMEIYTGSQESPNFHISVKTWPICFNSVSLDAYNKNENIVILEIFMNVTCSSVKFKIWVFHYFCSTVTSIIECWP